VPAHRFLHLAIADVLMTLVAALLLTFLFFSISDARVPGGHRYTVWFGDHPAPRILCEDDDRSVVVSIGSLKTDIFLQPLVKKKRMKIIRCSLWGDIAVSSLALHIIDSPLFQRLHYIRQTGFSYKVFPTATTSRFAHSLGVYHITKSLLHHIMIHQPEEFAAVGDKMELICIAGLCHDLGHGPMSHWFDDLCESLYHPDDRPAWTRHEKRSVSVFRAIVEQQHLDMSDEDVEFICGQIDKKSDEESGPWYGRLINNPVSGIDTDKLDYLLRDGTAYGLRSTFDPMRIIRNCRVIDNELCFCDRVVDELTAVFDIRNKMYRDIYMHPTIQKFDRCALNLIQSNPQAVETIRECIETEDIDIFLTLIDPWIYTSVDALSFSNLECRRWECFPPFEISVFKDSQRVLMKNIRLYHRKNPSISIPWSSIEKKKFL